MHTQVVLSIKIKKTLPSVIIRVVDEPKSTWYIPWYWIVHIYKYKQNHACTLIPYSRLRVYDYHTIIHVYLYAPRYKYLFVCTHTRRRLELPMAECQ